MNKLFPILGLLACSACWAQVAVDNSGTNSGSTAVKTGTCTISAISANSLVILHEVIDDDGTTTFNTPTATGLTFAQIGTTLHSTGNFYMLEWRAFTASALGSTAITATWNTTNADWNFACASFTGTAGTAANNGSDAIGNTNTATVANPTTSISATVTTSSHDKSKYFGGLVAAATVSETFTPGASYTAITANVFNSNFISVRTEISTNPVSPAASTAVNATASGNNTELGLFGVEILVGGGSPPTSPTCTISLMGAGPC